MSVQTGPNRPGENPVSRLVALRDGNGVDLALAVVSDWRRYGTVMVRSPRVDFAAVRCLVVGDITIEV